MPQPRKTTTGRASTRAPAASSRTSGGSSSAPRKAVPVDLGLQGGGAHGAFTWGVLDRLLEEPWLRFDGISGTSAGAMNAAVMAAGLHAGRAGRRARGARGILAARVGCRADEPPAARPARDPHRHAGRSTTRRCSSPWTSRRRCSRPTTPASAGRTRCAKILAESVDFARLARRRSSCSSPPPTCAPGRGRIFRNAELTPDVLLASACLPTMFQAVEIDGEPYWDGGYAGNPSMAPLIRECTASDTILVQINPIERPGTPRTAREIHNRLNEISFNATLLKELQAAALLRQVADPGTGEGAAWAHMRVHRIASDVMLELGYSSKMITEWPFFTHAARRGPQVGHGVSRRAPLRSGRALDARPRRDAGRNLTRHGTARHPAGAGRARLAVVPRLERARARACGGIDRGTRGEGAAARELDG